MFFVYAFTENCQNIFRFLLSKTFHNLAIKMEVRLLALLLFYHFYFQFQKIFDYFKNQDQIKKNVN